MGAGCNGCDKDLWGGRVGEANVRVCRHDGSGLAKERPHVGQELAGNALSCPLRLRRAWGGIGDECLKRR